MNAAARADAYRRQTGRAACTLAAFWTNEDHTRGFEMRCGVTYDGMQPGEVDALQTAHRCRQLTPAQARRDRHKTNRAKRQQQAATATSMRAAVDGLPALASSPGEVGSPASPAVQHPATANRPAPLRPGT